MSVKIVRHQDLEVYKKAFEAAMQIFEISKTFPKEETYSLIDQMRRASRSVCANIAEGWRKRRYEAAFISKLNDAEGETAETQTWLEFSVRCGYLNKDTGRNLFKTYDEIISMLVTVINNSENWVLPSGQRTGFYLLNKERKERDKKKRLNWRDLFFSPFPLLPFSPS